MPDDTNLKPITTPDRLRLIAVHGGALEVASVACAACFSEGEAYENRVHQMVVKLKACLEIARTLE